MVILLLLMKIFPVGISVINFDDVVVDTHQLLPFSNGTFSHQIVMDGVDWDTVGYYTAMLCFLT